MKEPTNEDCGQKLVEFADKLEKEYGHPTVFSKGTRIYGEAMMDKSSLGGLDFLIKVIDLFNTEIKKRI